MFAARSLLRRVQPLVGEVGGVAPEASHLHDLSTRQDAGKHISKRLLVSLPATCQ